MVVKEILGKSYSGKWFLWEGAMVPYIEATDERTGSEWVCLKIKSF